jgi:hypothetical protein
MKNIQLLRRVLSEEFVDGVISSYNKTYYEIFVNPTFKEIASIKANIKANFLPRVRFIIDCVSGQVYVFDSRLVHYEAAESPEVNLQDRYPDDELICGEADIVRSNRLKFIGCDTVALMVDDIHESENKIPDSIREQFQYYKNMLDEGKFVKFRVWFGNSLENYFYSITETYLK